MPCQNTIQAADRARWRLTHWLFLYTVHEHQCIIIMHLLSFIWGFMEKFANNSVQCGFYYKMFFNNTSCTRYRKCTIRGGQIITPSALDKQISCLGFSFFLFVVAQQTKFNNIFFTFAKQRFSFDMIVKRAVSLESGLLYWLETCLWLIGIYTQTCLRHTVGLTNYGMHKV